MKRWWPWALTAILVALCIVYYFIDATKTVSVLQFSLRYAIPLILAAMVGIICERSGVINIGIEGQMLMSAFAGFFGASITGSLVLGALIGVGTGMIMGAMLAVGAVTWKMDQIIAGTVINILATGLTSFFYAQGHMLPANMPTMQVPLLSSIPLVGPVFFINGPFAFAALIIVVVLQVMLFLSLIHI